MAYRELRRLEARLAERERELRRRGGIGEQGALALFFPIANMRGIEIDAFAVSLARVTLWMGHKLAVDEIGVSEATLPLADLSGVRQGDALRVPWPRADAIIGNPPYHGSQQLRQELGDDYVEWLRATFGIGVKDYCVYWFRMAHDHLAPGGRAGLVGTNSIRENRARPVSLDYIAAHGGVITDAVSAQDWPGEAVVNVSIVNWLKQPQEPPSVAVLDGIEVAAVTTALRPIVGPEAATPLAENSGYSFQGAIPVGEGFVLSPEEAKGLLDRPEAPYREVVRPYLIGDDIAGDPAQGPRRFIVDFGLRSLEEAEAFPAALDIVRARVKPQRDRNRDAGFRLRWWRFGRPRPAMRAALRGLSRYVAANAQGKRILFAWQDPWTCPSNLTNVFAFEDDYAMGVLMSRAHGEWARLLSKLRVDIRYTPTTAFQPFPWPELDSAGRERIAALTRNLIERRQAICAEREFGLTKLYNAVDEGAWTEIRDLHRALDEEVAAAYGWPRRIAQDAAETNARLLELNREIAHGGRPYAPFRHLEEG